MFLAKASSNDFTIDISNRHEDTFLGDEWYKFLLRCKYTIGVEGGASILDKDGKIRTKTHEYLYNHPNASFEEIEAACFPNLDGYLKFSPISPRHLEACVTKTCQVLVEGDYNGILEAGKHYIELKRDFSNIDQVLSILKKDNLRQDIINRAYEDIVESGKYTYQVFVNFILEKSLNNISQKNISFTQVIWTYTICYWTQFIDILSWRRICYQRQVLPFLGDMTFSTLRLLPPSVKLQVRRIKKLTLFLLPNPLKLQLRRLKAVLFTAAVMRKPQIAEEKQNKEKFEI